MIPNMRFAAAFAIAFTACVTALGQEPSDQSFNTVVVTGRLETLDHTPIAYTGITYANLKKRKNANDDYSLATDSTGAFSFDAEIGGDYLVSLQGYPISLGEFEINGKYNLSMGTILLELLSKDKAVLRSGISVKITPSPASNLRQGSVQSTGSATITAIYLGPAPHARDPLSTTRVHIFLSNGKEVQPSVLKDQVGASSPAISNGGKAVGWLADYENCCTSYPLSLNLILYRAGKPNCIFHGDGRAIFNWRFLSDGKKLAFYQDFPHGPLHSHYELHDVATCSLLDQDDEDENADDSSKPPAWVNELDNDSGTDSEQ